MLIVEILNWLAIPIVVLLVIRLCKDARRKDGKKRDVWAVSSAAMVILNPHVLPTFLWYVFGVSYGGIWGGVGSSEIQSFSYGFINVIVSIVGIRRIMRSKDHLYGVFYAIPGLMLGLAVVCFWLWIAYTFFSGWS